jgi:hypothetical protein
MDQAHRTSQGVGDLVLEGQEMEGIHIYLRMSLSVEACPSLERRTRTTGVDFTMETLPEPHFLRSRRAQAPAVAHSTMNRSSNPGRATLFPTPIAFRQREKVGFLDPAPAWGWSLDITAEYITTNGSSFQLHIQQTLLSGPSFTQRNAQFAIKTSLRHDPITTGRAKQR